MLLNLDENSRSDEKKKGKENGKSGTDVWFELWTHTVSSSGRKRQSKSRLNDSERCKLSVTPIVNFREGL